MSCPSYIPRKGRLHRCRLQRIAVACTYLRQEIDFTQIWDQPEIYSENDEGSSAEVKSNQSEYAATFDEDETYFSLGNSQCNMSASASPRPASPEYPQSSIKVSDLTTKHLTLWNQMSASHSTTPIGHQTPPLSRASTDISIPRRPMASRGMSTVSSVIDVRS